MARLRILLFATPVLLTCAAWAQDAPPAGVVQPLDKPAVKHYKHSLGFAAGTSTGYGLSYRFTPNRFGVQATFMPLMNERETRLSIGLTFLYTLVEAEKCSLFLYQGNHLLHRQYEAYAYGWPWPPEELTVRDTQMTHGLGVGMEFILAQRVGLNLMGGYALYDHLKTLDFTGEVGLYFKF